MSRGTDGVTRRGTSNGNSSGSASARRARKCWMLSWFGDGISCPCFSCGDVLLYSTVQADRIIPGVLGGTYARGNIRPSCATCNIRAGNLVRDMIRREVPKRTIIRQCRLGLL